MGCRPHSCLSLGHFLVSHTCCGSVCWFNTLQARCDCRRVRRMATVVRGVATSIIRTRLNTGHQTTRHLCMHTPFGARSNRTNCLSLNCIRAWKHLYDGDTHNNCRFVPAWCDHLFFGSGPDTLFATTASLSNKPQQRSECHGTTCQWLWRKSDHRRDGWGSTRFLPTHHLTRAHCLERC